LETLLNISFVAYRNPMCSDKEQLDALSQIAVDECVNAGVPMVCDEMGATGSSEVFLDGPCKIAWGMCDKFQSLSIDCHDDGNGNTLCECLARMPDGRDGGFGRPFYLANVAGDLCNDEETMFEVARSNCGWELHVQGDYLDDEWRCDDSWFGDGECDCGCGVFDQNDCADMSVSSCQTTQACPEGSGIVEEHNWACVPIE
jgi:hypothetical protein